MTPNNYPRQVGGKERVTHFKEITNFLGLYLYFVVWLKASNIFKLLILLAL